MSRPTLLLAVFALLAALLVHSASGDGRFLIDLQTGSLASPPAGLQIDDEPVDRDAFLAGPAAECTLLNRRRSGYYVSGQGKRQGNRWLMVKHWRWAEEAPPLQPPTPPPLCAASAVYP